MMGRNFSKIVVSGEKRSIPGKKAGTARKTPQCRAGLGIVDGGQQRFGGLSTGVDKGRGGLVAFEDSVDKFCNDAHGWSASSSSDAVRPARCYLASSPDAGRVLGVAGSPFCPRLLGQLPDRPRRR